MGAYADIVTAVRAAANLAGGLLQILWGTPGDTVLWPEDDPNLAKPRDTGALWDASGPFPLLLEQVGAVIDAGGSGAPLAHAASHVTGTDQIADAIGGIDAMRGLLSVADKNKLDGIDSGADVTGSNAPQAHATSHTSGNGDAIKLDDLGTPDDNTDLDASTGRHGLLPRLGGGTTNFLRADGTWAAPGGGGTSATDELDPAATTGAETTLTLSHTPGSAAALFVFRNGVLMRLVNSLGASKMEYTWSTTTVTFVASGAANDWYVAKYTY